jgi:hypothetical protein
MTASTTTVAPTRIVPTRFCHSLMPAPHHNYTPPVPTRYWVPVLIPMYPFRMPGRTGVLRSLRYLRDRRRRSICTTPKRAGCERGASQKSMNWRLWLSGIAISVLTLVGGVRAGAQAPSPATAPQNTQSAAAPAASPKDIVGIWQGTLRIPKTDQHPEVDLRLVVKISRTDACALQSLCEN